MPSMPSCRRCRCHRYQLPVPITISVAVVLVMARMVLGSSWFETDPDAVVVRPINGQNYPGRNFELPTHWSTTVS